MKKGLVVNDFDFLRMIGKGTFGRVFQVRKKDTHRIYAMKVLSKREIVAKKEVAHTIGERKILQRSSESPFLLGLKFSFQSETDLYLIMDYKSGGELFHHLQKEGRFTEDRARFYTAEIVLAFEHLHKFDIVYRSVLSSDASQCAVLTSATAVISSRRIFSSTRLDISFSAISDCRSRIFPRTLSPTRSAVRQSISRRRYSSTITDTRNWSISGSFDSPHVFEAQTLTLYIVGLLVCCYSRCVVDGVHSTPRIRNRCTN